MDPRQARDKLFIVTFLFSMMGGLWLSLRSAGYLLAFNINTLMITGIVFTVSAANRIMKAKPAGEQVNYIALCAIPIALRYILNTPMFSSWRASVSGWEQLSYMMQIAALWSLVAVSEEAFRASMMNLAEIFARFRDRQLNTWYRGLFANTVWLLFHFVQRPFNPIQQKWYMIWLFTSGIVMTLALEEAGLGAATIIHLLVNLIA